MEYNNGSNFYSNLDQFDIVDVLGNSIELDSPKITNIVQISNSSNVKYDANQNGIIEIGEVDGLISRYK